MNLASYLKFRDALDHAKHVADEAAIELARIKGESAMEKQHCFTCHKIQEGAELEFCKAAGHDVLAETEAQLMARERALYDAGEIPVL